MILRLLLLLVALPFPQDGLRSRVPDEYLRVPAENPATEARIALGRRLFFDPSLSRDGTVACVRCHDPARAFGDDRAVAIGIAGRAGTRNAPAIVNRGYGRAFFWDGRDETLEAQVVKPIENPNEMGTTVAAVVARLARDRTYAPAFTAAFGRAANAVDVARALSTYVRTIQSADSAVDRYRDGDRTALSAEELRGQRVFRGPGLCTTCHQGSTFTDEDFHNTGVAWNGARFTDEGRGAVTGKTDDRGAFKTPTLREVARSAPYMHNGSLPTLEAVVEFYDRGGRPNPQLDKEIVPLKLSAADKAALVAFLKALTGTITEGTGGR